MRPTTPPAVFVVIVDPVFGTVFAEVVQQVADVVQQRRDDQPRRGTGLLGEMGTL